ncbi:hypothetical protein EDD16DRAFT_1527870 [Pisolithus croceorrhizus]|nr:hypothetical protein EDD16DRAFT_1527870 [Pisolithus croceorrhizus]KAI6156189.1 hypothetical protein EDD17DRAFT_1512654 [Pisolithus thermaeus]
MRLVPWTVFSALLLPTWRRKGFILQDADLYYCITSVVASLQECTFTLQYKDMSYPIEDVSSIRRMGTTPGNAISAKNLQLALRGSTDPTMYPTSLMSKLVSSLQMVVQTSTAFKATCSSLCFMPNIAKKVLINEAEVEAFQMYICDCFISNKDQSVWSQHQ